MTVGEMFFFSRKKSSRLTEWYHCWILAYRKITKITFFALPSAVRQEFVGEVGKFITCRCHVSSACCALKVIRIGCLFCKLFKKWKGGHFSHKVHLLGKTRLLFSQFTIMEASARLSQFLVRNKLSRYLNKLRLKHLSGAPKSSSERILLFFFENYTEIWYNILH